MGDGLRRSFVAANRTGGSGKTAQIVANMIAECSLNAGFVAVLATLLDPNVIWRTRFARLVPIGSSYKNGIVTFPNGSTITIGMPKKNVE